MVQKNITDINFDYPSSECNMMLLPRRNDTIECCFICGANQAIWLLNSNPTSDNKPFFPFLQYQKPPSNANKLDCNGRCLACNVCYLFLMQQWKSYQENNTPILKRLYWLKRPAEEYLIIGGKCQNGMVPREVENIPVSQRYIPSSDVRTIDNVSTVRDRNYTYEEEKEKILLDRGSLSDEHACSLCSVKEKKNLMKYVLTSSQSSADVPFYSRVIKGKNEIIEFNNSDGRILVCSQCHSTLYRQWLEFEKLSIPWHDREFIVDPIANSTDVESVACFLCHDTLSREALYPLYCKKVSNEPFYPFLKNLAKSYNTIPVCEEGVTYCCSKCKLFLKKQWDVFEESNVFQEERVYRIHPSQPPLLPSEIEADKNIACFICSAKNDVKYSKRIYCNSGSNMNLSFLKSFPRNTDGFFCEETGETFVCVSCFKELKQHWMKYRSTLFESGHTMHENEFLSTKHCQITNIGCEICHFKGPADAMLKLNICPVSNKDNALDEDQPFFPLLKELICTEDKPFLNACRLCSLNLLNQWSSFEASNDLDVPNRYERSYKFNDFLCYVCNGSVSRHSIGWENIDNIKEGVEIRANNFAVKFNNDIGICDECKLNHIKVKKKQVRILF